MVLEALAAISLTGNIIQFVHFGFTLIRTTHDIHESGSSNTPETIELNIIAKHLEGHIRNLETPRGSEITAENTRQNNNDSSTLSLARQCQAVATELLSAIGKLHAGKMAKLSYGVEKRLEERRNNEPSTADGEPTRSYHVPFGIANQAVLIDTLNTLSQDNGYRHTDLVGNIERIASRLRSVEASISSSTGHSLSDEICCKFLELCDIYKNAAESREILATLQFDYMRARHEAIHEAHERTFEWIFRTKQLEPSDPRASVRFLEWLENGDGIFWIAGKPGSGKSTLMKFLDNHHAVEDALRLWAGSGTLYRSSFYFWNPGTHMQKSLQGLLQSLLYGILSTCPDMIYDVCKERYGSQIHEPWSVPDLKHCLARVETAKTDSTSKFYFHVDGLDEFNGDHNEVVSVLERFASSRIKLCLSSRPWNCFELAFGGHPSQKLYLESFTREDIQLFAQEHLTKDLGRDHFQMPRELFASLVKTIVERSKGVFLWVRLVIRSLCDGLINGDPPTLLQARLDAIPTDLEIFFASILHSVDPVYRERMAIAFSVALKTKSPLRVINYSFLDEEDNNFGLELDFRCFDDEEIQHRVLKTSRQLAGRYKGLLECSRPGPLGGLLYDTTPPHDTVDFLHRTLTDFLQGPKLQAQLSSYLPFGFNVNSTISRILLAEGKYANGPLRNGSFSRVLDFIEEVTQDERNPELEYRTLDHIERLFEKEANNFPTVPSLRNRVLKAAIHIHRIDYVNHRLQNERHSGDMNMLLSHCLLCPGQLAGGSWKVAFIRTSGECYESMGLAAKGLNAMRIYDSHIEMLSLLLERGANPNAIFYNKTIWEEYLEHSFTDSSVLCERNWPKVLNLLLQFEPTIASQTSIWAQIFESGYTMGEFKQQFSSGAMDTMCLLFNAGLKPNDHCNGTTVFQYFLRTLQWHYGKYTLLRHSMLQLFFLHGADVRLMLQDDEVKPWIEYLIGLLCICTSPADPSEDFKIMLKNGLDPNTQIDGRSIWEDLLESVQTFGFNLDAHRQEVSGNTVLLFLRYGADPQNEVLHRLLGHYDGGKSIFGPLGASIMDTARRETAFIQARDIFLQNPPGMTLDFSHIAPGAIQAPEWHYQYLSRETAPEPQVCEEKRLSISGPSWTGVTKVEQLSQRIERQKLVAIDSRHLVNTGAQTFTYQFTG
ncbi:hypothetical protein N0V90_011899 [Kalmusia sp. IMI 367209]|nr:hypothetical protein N0V90_011899 [Kalmusia sp. IMI 367209]